MNASWSGNGITLNPSVNISLAIAVKDGVVGAVIPDAAKMPLADIAARRKDLAERARAGRLRPADIAGGTFTLSNLGMFGIDAFSAIITPPQAAVLAVGRIADRVVPVNGQPGIRPMLTLTLSSDHRVVDGAQAAVFLRRSGRSHSGASETMSFQSLEDVLQAAASPVDVVAQLADRPLRLSRWCATSSPTGEMNNVPGARPARFSISRTT